MPSSSAETNSSIPLVVDLDGTLLKTDSLWEGFFRMLATHPRQVLRVPVWLSKGKTTLKSELAEYGAQHPETFPFNEVVLSEIQNARNDGRPVYLATAANGRIARAVADHLGCFDGIFASDREVNLKGARKADLLCAEFGEKGFDYIGDSAADKPIWRRCREAVYVGAETGLLQEAAEAGAACRFLGTNTAPSLKDFMAALRVQQWMKNCLIAVPLFLAHLFTLQALAMTILAFVAFCACASSAYLLNDLLDLPSDRSHPRKKRRPFASGAIPLHYGPPLIALGMMIGVVCCFFLPKLFALILLCYYALTIAYSVWLKRLLFLDIIVLTSLYGIRIAAGAAAIGSFLSNWLLGFSLFIFLGLALIKRASELHVRQSAGSARAHGRAYTVADRALLEGMAVTSGFSAEIILVLYIDSIKASNMYSSPQVLWLSCPLMLYWYGRLLFIMHRGQMEDDPVRFVLKDKNSILCLLLGLGILLLAL